MFRVLFYAAVLDSKNDAPSPRQTERYGRKGDARAHIQQSDIYRAVGIKGAAALLLVCEHNANPEHLPPRRRPARDRSDQDLHTYMYKGI